MGKKVVIYILLGPPMDPPKKKRRKSPKIVATTFAAAKPPAQRPLGPKLYDKARVLLIRPFFDKVTSEVEIRRVSN